MLNDTPATGTASASVMDIVIALLRHWKLLVALPLLFALLMAAWTLTQERMYIATASLLPQQGESGGISGAAALAQQFGVSLGTDGGRQSPQLYVELLRSQGVLRKAVEAEYTIPVEGQMVTGTLIEFLEVKEDGEVPGWVGAVEELRDAMTTYVARETGLVEFSVKVEDGALAEQIASKLLRLLGQFNIQVRQTRAEEEGRFTGERLEDARAELTAAETELQRFLQANREFRNAPELVFQHDRLQRQVSMRQDVYTELLRSREQARIDAVRDTPLFTVVDDPADTAQPEERGLVMRTILGFLIGLIVALTIAAIAEFARRRREAGDRRYWEIQSLAGQAWRDLRNPRRWLGITPSKPEGE